MQNVFHLATLFTSSVAVLVGYIRPSSLCFCIGNTCLRLDPFHGDITDDLLDSIARVQAEFIGPKQANVRDFDLLIISICRHGLSFLWLCEKSLRFLLSLAPELSICRP